MSRKCSPSVPRSERSQPSGLTPPIPGNLSQGKCSTTTQRRSPARGPASTRIMLPSGSPVGVADLGAVFEIEVGHGPRLRSYSTSRRGLEIPAPRACRLAPQHQVAGDLISLEQYLETRAAAPSPDDLSVSGWRWHRPGRCSDAARRGCGTPFSAPSPVGDAQPADGSDGRCRMRRHRDRRRQRLAGTSARRE